MRRLAGCEKFFSGKVSIFIGERDGAADAAALVAKGLASAGLAFEELPCLQHEHVQLYHNGALWTHLSDVLRFVEYAGEMRDMNPDAIRPPPCPARTVPARGRINLRDHRHAVEALSPLIARRMRLATRNGQLAFGNWWLGSLNAETFEMASNFGLHPHATASSDKQVHVLLEVWPTGADGARLDCVNGRPHTTMIHVPFGHDIALHLVEESADGARRRTDDNLQAVFG